MSASIQTRYWCNPFSSRVSQHEKIFFLLRFGVMGCFVGHGFWGIAGKSGWIPFFEIFFFPEETIRILMPTIGIMDILVGICAFFYPTRALLIWATTWTIFTAALRPSAGMGMSEFFERAGNYMLPLAFLWLVNGFDRSQNFRKILTKDSLQIEQRAYDFEFLCRLGLALLLIGHGGLAFFNEHPVLIKHFSFLGLDAFGPDLKVFGLFEMILGLFFFIFPRIKGLLTFILILKLSSEFLHPMAGVPVDIFETIERMGDYILPLILMNLYAEGQPRKVAHFAGNVQ